MNRLIKHFFGESINTGLLLLRLGVGMQMLLHGWPKLSGGPDKWVKLGQNMALIGVDFAPGFWGFMAGFAEFGGGLLIIFGWLTRPGAFLLSFTMLIASIRHWSEEGATFMDGSHSFELFFVFIALYLTGGGKFSIDELLHRKPMKT